MNESSRKSRAQMVSLCFTSRVTVLRYLLYNNMADLEQNMKALSSLAIVEKDSNGDVLPAWYIISIFLLGLM